MVGSYLEPFQLNIAPNQSVLSTANITDTNISLEGGGTLINNGQIGMLFGGKITDEILGNGTIAFGGWHDTTGGYSIEGAVGPGQTILFSGGEGSSASISDPATFHGTVDLGGTPAGLYLTGISADSYDIKNDFLTLYQGNTPVYTLRVEGALSSLYVAGGHAGVSLGIPFYGLGPPSDTLPQHTTGV